MIWRGTEEREKLTGRITPSNLTLTLTVHDIRTQQKKYDDEPAMIRPTAHLFLLALKTFLASLVLRRSALESSSLLLLQLFQFFQSTLQCLHGVINDRRVRVRG